MEKNALPVLHDLYSVRGTLEELSAPTKGLKVSEDYVFVEVFLEDTQLSIIQQVKNLYPNYLGIKYSTTAKNTVTIGGGNTIKEKSMTDIFMDFYKEITTNEVAPHQLEVIDKILEEDDR